MLFVEALNALTEGKIVSRETWTDEDGYLTLMAGMKHVWKILTLPNPNAGNHIFSVEEMLADDWKEIDRDGVKTSDLKVAQKAA